MGGKQRLLVEADSGDCASDVEPGTYTLEFAGEQRKILVPGGEQ